MEATTKSVERRRLVGPGAAAFAGWLAVAAGNAIDILSRGLGPAGFSARLVHLAFDLGHTLFVGVLAALAAELWSRFGPKKKLAGYATVAAVAVVVGVFVLREDLDGIVGRVLGEESDLGAGSAVAAAVSALAVPAALATGRAWGRPHARLFPLGVAVLFVLANPHVLVNGYPGIHLFVSATAAALFAGALHGAELPRRVERAATGRRAIAGVAVLGVFATASVVFSPPRQARAELLQRDTALFARFLSDRAGHRADVRIPPALRPWFQPRTIRASVPPSRARLAPDNAIILFVSIDALRMELFEPMHQKVAPNLHALAKTSFNFTQARSFGSDTRFSLAALFTGRYLSMCEWSWRSRVRPTLEKDRGPRLPELLNDGGVRTITSVTLPNMLVPRIGIVRGFREEYVKAEEKGGRGATEQAIDHIIERLENPGPGRLFYFTHLIDPHVPYRKHGKSKPKTDYEAYLGEVTFSDFHLGRLMTAVKELGLDDRVVFIVSSDHGEGFGEHGIFTHNKPLYEVMVHIPLFIRIPGTKPRAIDAHVSQMDVGPTVLDLFGLPTPGWFMAESLVPLMAGEPPPPHRPIFMERATEVALLFEDGIKVMLRTRPESEEIYDLENDPEEEHDLREELGEEGDRRVALTRAYAETHKTKEGAVRHPGDKR